MTSLLPCDHLPSGDITSGNVLRRCMLTGSAYSQPVDGRQASGPVSVRLHVDVPTCDVPRQLSEASAVNMLLTR